jgi:hypothetical protein
MSYLQAVGGFLIFDGAVSILDGLVHGDGPKAQVPRIARLAAGAAYAMQVFPYSGVSKALGAYMMIDGAVSFMFESIASGREQAHLRYLRAARIGIGLLTFLFL